MNKIADGAYDDKGTRFHLRAFEDPLQEEKPVFVIEEGQGNQTSLEFNRVDIAKELADARGYKPDDITWLEQAPDGALTQVEFEYTHTDNIVENYRDMEMFSEEQQEAVDTNKVNYLKIDRYNTRQSEASRPEFQAQVGDALEPYERRQNEEFAKMELPPAVISFEEMRQFPTQQEFENEPDVRL